MSTQPVVVVEGLHKRFDSVIALDDVNLAIHAGSITGLLGANGSGKSTLIRHMVGLYLPDRGRCVTLGCDAAKLGPRELSRIGYVHQEGQLVDWMTVSQLVSYVASYYSGWNADLEQSYFSRFELEEHAVVGKLSPGHRQKLAILLALGFEPDLLILDEPAAALDPLARRGFLELLLEIIQDPERTILISSHILSDVEKVIDHAVILEGGKVRRDCGFDDLREEFTKIRLTALGDALPDPLPFCDLLTCRRNGKEAVLVFPALPSDELERKARDVNGSIETLPLNLEEIYELVLRHEGHEVPS